MVLACDIKFDEGRVRTLVLLPNGLYLAPDERLADADFSLIWCRDCGRLTAGEWLEPAEFLESQIAACESENPTPEMSFLYGKDVTARKQAAESCRRKLGALRSRTAPPRCIDCSGTEIEFIDDRHAVLPPTGERFDVSAVFANTSIDNRLTILSVDGFVLGEIARLDVQGIRIDCTYSYSALLSMLAEAGIEVP